MVLFYEQLWQLQVVGTFVTSLHLFGLHRYVLTVNLAYFLQSGGSSVTLRGLPVEQEIGGTIVQRGRQIRCIQVHVYDRFRVITRNVGNVIIALIKRLDQHLYRKGVIFLFGGRGAS